MTDALQTRESAMLVLEDGRVFRGDRYGAAGPAWGEAVFNTSMTGYQEVLTDPSYTGQLVTMTYPLIGNYGTTPADAESGGGPRVAGFIFHEPPPIYSSWRAEESLEAYLTRYGVAALCGIDTRALTRHIRSAGAMRGGIVAGSTSVDEALAQVRGQVQMNGLDLATGASTEQRYVIEPVGERRYRVVAYDFGVKAHSLQMLAERGCEVTVIPAATAPADVAAQHPDGLFVSNGPGDPEAVGHALDTIRQMSDAHVPVFGICLGHQLIARAFGARTYKLPYGHRGGNHPVRRLTDGAVEITAQNHGFAVAGDAHEIGGAPMLRPTHLNLNDGTVEGLEHRDRPVFSVQYHPEAAPGPHDSRYLFDRFTREMRDSATRRAATG